MDLKDVAALPTEEDYRRYDRVWRRVNPGLDPYPEVRRRQESGTPLRPDASAGEPETLRALLRDELSEAQTCRYLARLAPSPEARRTLLRIGTEEAGHAKTLQSLHFLLTGETYPVTVVLPPQPRLLWRDRLRLLWHGETGAGAAYTHAAERTRDPSLRRVFERLSADEYRHAEQLRRLLERELK